MSKDDDIRVVEIERASDENIMPVRGRFDRVYFRKRRNAVLWALDWIGFVLDLFGFSFIFYSRCSFVNV